MEESKRSERLKKRKKKGQNHNQKWATMDRGWTDIFPDSGDQTGKLCVIDVCLSVYLQEGYDERSQREVGGFLELGVEFFDG